MYGVLQVLNEEQRNAFTRDWLQIETSMRLYVGLILPVYTWSRDVVSLRLRQ